MGKLDGKIAVVTGGGSGIGEATARLFVAEGAVVLIADIDEVGGTRVSKDLGSAAAFLKTDVGVPEQVEAMVKFTAERFSRLGYIV
jgi:NAD(P)-dependent dehydrogenase (short-subunit alcohol dehydrogenase family)